MATTQTFRSALNGFNREDVVRYIEFLNAKHQTEVNQLRTELETLRASQKQEEERPAEEPQPSPDLSQEVQRLQEELDAALAAKGLAEENLKTALDEKIATVAQLDSALRQQNSFKSRMEEELEAYRRAERTERLARERAEQLYRQANGALSDATVKVDAAAGQIGTLTDRVMDQLGQLQEAVAGSKRALRDAVATMYTIKPQEDEE